MDMLIIYDETGYVISQMGGSVREPVGIPFIWVEVPYGKYVSSIDVSGAEPLPVFEDIPKSDIQKLQEQMDELTIILGDTLLGGM